MKQTILICDCCKLPVPAVKSVDLCEEHLRKLGPNRRERRSANKPKRGAWNKADYESINPRIMKLAEARPLFTGATVSRELRIPQHIAREAVNQLLKSKQLVAAGTGTGRKLSKAH